MRNTDLLLKASLEFLFGCSICVGYDLESHGLYMWWTSYSIRDTDLILLNGSFTITLFSLMFGTWANNFPFLHLPGWPNWTLPLFSTRSIKLAALVHEDKDHITNKNNWFKLDKSDVLGRLKYLLSNLSERVCNVWISML